VTGATLKLNGVQVLGTSDFSTGVAIMERQVNLAKPMGLNTVTLTGEPSGKQLTVRVRVPDVTPPIVNLNCPVVADTFLTSADTLTISGSIADETPGLVSVNTGSNKAAPGTFSSLESLVSEGVSEEPVREINSALLSTTKHAYILRDVTPPSIAPLRPMTDTTVTSSTDSFTVAGYFNDVSRTVLTVDGDTVAIGSGGSVPFAKLCHLDVGKNGILLRAIDRVGHKTEFKRWITRSLGTEAVVDSGLIGTSASTTGIRPFKESVQFLYTGGGSIQTNAVPDSIRDATASVVRGKVLGRDAAGLLNVTVSVLSHPEYGWTRTRDGGWYDLVVNGGAQLTLVYNKAGYLEAQREVTPFANDYAVIDNLAMVGRSEKRTVAGLLDGQFVRTRMTSDANGDRDVRLMFKPQTVAQVDTTPGHTVSFSGNVQVRSTEYTIGADGPEAMPASLPPGSAYSYCIDLSLFETDSLALLVGANSLNTSFTKPVIGYVKNFLHLPVGSYMPNGYYDRAAGRWKAEADAVVMRVMGFTTVGDSAMIDVDGTGLRPTQGRLDTLQIDPYELTHVRQQLAAGDTVMRMVMTHFSDHDLNPKEYPQHAPQNLKAGIIQILQSIYHCITGTKGSIIECESCVLGEELPITGSPFTLNYRSFRAPGDKALRTLRIPLLGDDVPTNLQSIRVVMDVAGERSELVHDNPAAHDSATLSWDGNDAYGRRVDGSAVAHVAIGYSYLPTVATGTGGKSFDNSASTGTNSWTGVADRGGSLVHWMRLNARLGAPSAATDGLGGWTISPHHFFDTQGAGALYKGDGSVVLGEEQYPVVTT
ncbi:MAG: hypothetical protein ACRDL7_00925, partial [Gaiellaceae bacterium]